jgi:hypothetical protein
MEPNNPNPNPQVNPAAGAASAGNQPPQPTPYEEVMKAKNFKSNDDFAKSYREAETELGRTKNVVNTVKTQVEQQSQGSLTVDDKGNVIPKQGYVAPQGQPHYQSPEEQEVIYDPYTGKQITDPLQLQLAKMPTGQREAFIFNAMLEHRDQLQTQSFGIESEILGSAEAKGFEEDVKKEVAAVPLQYRANKKTWEDALLRVKGRKFDEMRKNAASQGVNDFLNTQSNQGLPPAGGGGSGSPLSPEMETSFQEYRRRFPNSKAANDRNVFLQFTKPDGGRS